MAFFSFAPIFLADPAYAARVPAVITCSDGMGNTATWSVQWDNENQYFSDKGDIAAHFCEGGHGGDLRVFEGVLTPDGLEIEYALRFFNGVIPNSDLSSEPVETSQDVDRSSEDTTRVTEEVVRTEDVARTEEVVREPDPQPVSVEPVAPVQPEITPEPIPEPSPEPEPAPEEPVTPVEPLEPSEVITPSPEPTEPAIEPTEPEISPEVPAEPEVEPTQGFSETVEALQQAIAETFESAIEAVGEVVEVFQTAGLDMTEEERKQAQSIVVPSVMVSLVATTSMIRK